MALEMRIYNRLCESEPNREVAEWLQRASLAQLRALSDRFESDVGDTEIFLAERMVTGPEWPERSRALLRHTIFNNAERIDQVFRFKNSNSYKCEDLTTISRMVPLGFDAAVNEPFIVEQLPTLFDPGHRPSRSRVVSDNVWVLIGCLRWTLPLPPKGMYIVRSDDEEAILNWEDEKKQDGVLYVQKGDGEELNEGDQCCLVYAHKPDPFNMLGGSGNNALHFELMKFKWNAESDSWQITQLRNSQLPILTWNDLQTVRDEVVFLKDLGWNTNTHLNDHQTPMAEFRRALSKEVTALIRSFIGARQWMGTLTG